MKQNQYDTAWKSIFDAYLQQAIDYCLPALSKLIDWSKGWVALDKELAAITKGAEAGDRVVDKLYKIHAKDGLEKRLLLHLEAQGKKEETFPKRMFTYYYRIFDKYQSDIVSCAILTDNNKKWRPDHFEAGFFGTKLRFDFSTIKLTDFLTKKAELEASSNPFATVILAHLSAAESAKSPDEQRKAMKFALTKRLYEKGMSKHEVMNLYKFIDLMIGLPEAFELEYLQAVYEIEESKKMHYISTAQRLGIKKGRTEGIAEGLEKGLEKGLERVAVKMLENKESLTYVAKMTGLTLARIKSLQAKLQKKTRH